MGRRANYTVQVEQVKTFSPLMFIVRELWSKWKRMKSLTISVFVIVVKASIEGKSSASRLNARFDYSSQVCPDIRD